MWRACRNAVLCVYSWQTQSPRTRSAASLLLEIDTRHCKNQDRGPANVKLFFFSIEHSQLFPSGQLSFHSHAPSLWSMRWVIWFTSSCCQDNALTLLASSLSLRGSILVR